MIHRILVLVPAEDHAGRAVSLAGRLAQQAEASVTLLRVLEENATTAAAPELQSQLAEIRNLLLDVETEQLEEMARALRESVPRVTARVRWGVTWEVALAEAERMGADLIVKPATGLTRSGPVFFGSTALHLFRRARCPVWVVGDDGGDPRRILAAVDPSGSPGRQRAARRIVDYAQATAGLTGASVEIATAWRALGADLLESSLSEEDWKIYRHGTESVAREGLERLVEELDDGGEPAAVHLIEGAACDVLPRLADEQGCDLIVMGTLTRPGEIGDLLGETAEMVLRSVRSSVLALPPLEVSGGSASGGRCVDRNEKGGPS